MALKKEITKEDGSIVSYWKVAEIWNDYINQKGAAQLLGYVSQKEREENKSPAWVKPVAFEGNIESRDVVYNHIKVNVAEFSEAIDV